MWYLDPTVHFLKTLVAENWSESSLEEQFGVLQNYDDFYNAFDIVTALFQHPNYEGHTLYFDAAFCDFS